MKSYTIKRNGDGLCMSVKCDFYQTCVNNSVSKFYKTKRKFEPLINAEVCVSINSGKRSELRDNNYPMVMNKFIENTYL
jgi:hypothetical protein